MPSRPANDIHPEDLAVTAREADTRGRFWVHIDADTDRSAPEWARYRAPRPAWRDRAVTMSGFDPGIGPVLDAMRECCVYGVTAKLLRERADAPSAWLDRFGTRERTMLVVDCEADGVRDDLDAWFWLAVHAMPIIRCDRAAFDAPTFFSGTKGPVFRRTTDVLSAAALDCAKEWATREDSVAIAPVSFDSIVVVAANGIAGALAQEAERWGQHPYGYARTSEPPYVGALQTFGVESWVEQLVPTRYEKVILSALDRGARFPGVSLDARRAIAAAEAVAIAEGRPPQGANALVDHTIALIASSAGKADPVSDATISRALSTLKTILDDGNYERGAWISHQGRALFRADVEGLCSRLSAAAAARRVRKTASNAVPIPPLRGVPSRPRNWRSRWLHLTLEDALAFLDALRTRTGAMPFVVTRDGQAVELSSTWVDRETLGMVQGEPFDERTDGWQWLLAAGPRVYLWWPDLSPRPEIRSTGDGLEVASWGHMELHLLGSTARHVMRSVLSHPTGTELREEKFRGPGPWRDVDWKLLRRRVAEVRALLLGPLGAVMPLDLEDTFTLPAAAALDRAGTKHVIAKYAGTRATLPK